MSTVRAGLGRLGRWPGLEELMSAVGSGAPVVAASASGDRPGPWRSPRCPVTPGVRSSSSPPGRPRSIAPRPTCASCSRRSSAGPDAARGRRTPSSSYPRPRPRAGAAPATGSPRRSGRWCATTSSPATRSWWWRLPPPSSRRSPPRTTSGPARSRSPTPTRCRARRWSSASRPPATSAWRPWWRSGSGASGAGSSTSSRRRWPGPCGSSSSAMRWSRSGRSTRPPSGRREGSTRSR